VAKTSYKPRSSSLHSLLFTIHVKVEIRTLYLKTLIGKIYLARMYVKCGITTLPLPLLERSPLEATRLMHLDFPILLINHMSLPPPNQVCHPLRYEISRLRNCILSMMVGIEDLNG
jgi:hypothetical protein